MASSCDVSTGNCPKFTLPNPGDTGTGKTSVVQHVGRLLGREAPINQCGHATSSNWAEFQVAEVLVYNFNEQSESTELIGGFRPVACDSGGILSTIFQINLDSRCFQNILFLWFQGQCHAVNVWACLDLGAPKFIAGSCGGREKRQVFFSLRSLNGR